MTAPIPRQPDPRCAAPGCADRVVRRHRRGRPPLYCSPACRRRAAQPFVEVDHDHDPASQGRPQGRVWLIRLRRHGRCVVIAEGLGRPSAEDLARQITDVLTAPSAAPRVPSGNPR